MTIATGDDATAADVLVIQATAASALTAAAVASANAATALANSEAAQAAATAAGELAAVALSVPALGVVTSISPTDTIPIGHNGSTVAVTAQTFNAGLATEVAAVSAVASAASTTLSEAVTIDLLSAAAPASDTDTFMAGQGSNILVRQTLVGLWTWVQSHLPGYLAPVLEITANLTVDSSHRGKILVVTGAGITISANFALMGSGFACDIVTSGAGTVVWGSGVTATNGGSGLPAGSYARLLAYTSVGGGNVVLAAVGTASSGTGSAAAVPGAVTGLTLGTITASSLAFTWIAPSSGGAVTYYQAQYRVTGTTTWTLAPTVGTAGQVLTGVASGTEYDVQVAAGNAAGLGPYTAIVNGTTSTASVAAPGTPANLSATAPTASTIALTWSAPSSGGAVASYTVQYRVTSTGGAWTQIAGLTSSSTTMTGLIAATGYDFQVAAVGAGGTSAFTATVNATTASASSTVANWNLYPTTLALGSGGNIYNLQVGSGTAPTSVAIGFSTSPTVPPNPMPALSDGLANNFNGNYWGTYMHAPATAGTWYGWAIGYASGVTLFSIVGAPVTVS